MTKLEWNAVGTRIFETGVDQGVLYVPTLPGVAWNGLISVSEAPVGGSISSFYIDGLKYLDYVSQEEFQATVTAYTYPDEFDDCIGVSAVGNGLFATQQAKKSFGLSYRTRIGNDLEGAQFAYKIHLIYNASAEPSSVSNHTMDTSADADQFSWRLLTKAPRVAGYVPTAHFVIDSRDTPEILLAEIETILYGDDTVPSRLPSAEELLSIFREYGSDGFDAGYLTETYFASFDGGIVPRGSSPLIGTIDGGGA